MSGDPGHDGPPPPAPAPAPIVGPSPFAAPRANGHEAAHDDAEAQANLEADGLDGDPAAGGPGKLGAVMARARAALVGLAGRFRQRGQDPTEGAEPAADAATAPAEPDAGPPAEARRAPRWSPAGWTWETRVGVAAVLSFVVLVGVFVARKASVGGRPAPTVNLPGPDKDKDRKGKADAAAVAKGGKPAPVSSAGGDSASPPPADVAAQAGAGSAAVEPRGADPAVGLKGDPPPQADPGSPPTGGEALPTLGNELTSPSASNPATPPVMATADPQEQPALPTGAPGGDPPPTLATDAKPADEPRAPEVAVKSEEPASQPPEQPAPVATAPPATAPAPAPASNPEPAAMPTPTPELAVAAAPLQPEKPRRLETVPSQPPDAGGGGGGEALGPGWVVIPSGGRRPGARSSGDPGSAGDEAPADASPTPRGGRRRAADGPPIRDDPAPGGGAVEPVYHTVQAGENFFTISKQYYNSGRYYKALHKANAAQVPEIAELYVGTVLRIPPPEALDSTLVDLPGPGALDGATVKQASSARGDEPVDPAPPTPRARPGLRRARNEPAEEPRRPTYKVKANDTLRSIARDTLGDSRRAGEIYNLNRDLLDGPKDAPAPGATLTLPEDAVVGRRAR